MNKGKSEDFDRSIYEAHKTFLDLSWCPQNTSALFIKGDYTSYEYTYIGAFVYLNDCAGGMAREELSDRINYIQLITFYQIPYLDFNELDDPLKLKVEIDYTQINLNSYVSRLTKIALHEYKIENSYLFYPPKTGIFYDAKSSEIRSYTFTNFTHDGWLGEFKMYFTPTKTSYQVIMYNIYDLIGQLGGIYGMIFEIFGILAFYVARKTYEYSLVNGMHKIESDIAEGEILQKEDTVVESPVRPIINRDLKHMDFNLTKQNIAHKI